MFLPSYFRRRNVRGDSRKGCPARIRCLEAGNGVWTGFTRFTRLAGAIISLIGLRDSLVGRGVSALSA